MGVITGIPNALAEATEVEVGLSPLGLLLYFLLIVGFLFVTMAIAKKDFGKRVFTSKLAQLYEQLYLFIENMCVGAIGVHGRKYIPMIITLWMIIFVGNVLALFMPASPTADLSFNLGMALLSVGYVQYEGIRAQGAGGHFKHFAGPKLNGLLVIVTGMIFIIEIISEVMKNVSLSLRLYGNIHGGHVAVDAMNKLGQGIFVPLGGLLIPLKLLTCVVQAMIFTLLTCVYLSLVTAHHEEHGTHEHENEHALDSAYPIETPGVVSH